MMKSQPASTALRTRDEKRRFQSTEVYHRADAKIKQKVWYF